MQDNTKPNLVIPISLWGEVKVAAYRRGCKPVELVIECLREKFDDGYRSEKGLPSRASVKALRDKVDALGVKEVVPPVKTLPVPVSAPAKVVSKSPFKFTPDTCPKHNFVNVGGASRCMECGVML